MSLAAQADDKYQAVHGVDVVVDGRAYQDLAPPWSPGLLVVGPGGDVLEVGPGGDLVGLERWLAAAPGNRSGARGATTRS